MYEPVPEFRLPESTAGYLTDPLVLKAVDSLLDEDSSTLPSTLDSTELASYLRARAAALAVKYDTVIALEELWRAIWGRLLGGWLCDAEWKEDRNPDHLWDEQAFWHRHLRSGYAFWTGIELQRPSDDQMPCIRLYCSLLLTSDEEETELLEGKLAGFELTDEDHSWSSWMYQIDPCRIPVEQTVELSEMKAIADRIYQAVQEVTL
ncbi:hypothetical protein [uncultured Novosphingobium sp.]|uniref:hypothetical protein n=1 Tax=uncultured Novosphingobium sp. TaxID=292277 RepID=UPI0025906AC3|nr:hypothetical protein [uncultured Novosphingobium sp.]